MRKNIACGMIMFAAVLMAGCGKEPEKVYGITVSYPELTASETLSVIRTGRNNPAAVTDTAFRVVLDEYNSYTAFVEFQDESHDIVLVAFPKLKKEGHFTTYFITKVYLPGEQKHSFLRKYQKNRGT